VEAIVLAAGKGTRMRGLCDARPKPMLPLANQPILEIIASHLAAAGIERVFFVIGHHAARIRSHYDAHASPIPVEFIIQEKATGTGSAALLGRGRMKEEPFFLAFGDIVVSGANYASMVRAYGRDHSDVLLSTRWVEDPCRGAAVYVNEHGDVTRIVEKPPRGSSTTNFDNAGLFCFRPEIWDRLEKVKPSPRGEYELTDAIAATLEAGRRIRAFELSGYWVNLTGPEDFLQANGFRLAELLSARGADPAARIPCAVHPTARVEGAEIGPNVSVGPRCRIQPGARVQDAVLLEDALVEQRAVVRHAVLGAGARVPSGGRLEGTPREAAVLLDGQTC